MASIGRVRFIENPFLDDQIEDAIVRALDDIGDEIVSRGQSYIGPFSSSAAGAIEKELAHRGPLGPVVVVKIGRGLGRIFEFSKQGRRSTRSGANRGVMQRREFFHRAKEEVVRRGLELARYL